MAPIKFEEHIKEKFDGREIQPSADSWDRLNARLENTKRSSGKKWWYSSVAAVAVIVVASLFFLNQQRPVENLIVEEPVEEPIKTPENSTDFNEPVQVASEEVKEKEAVHKNERITSEKPEIISPVETVQKEEQNTGIAEVNREERENLEPIFIDPPKQVEVEQKYASQIEELLARVEKQETSDGEISEAEVDVLLAEAAREISRNENYKGEVNADALLADVEFEIDQSFRQEVFEVLKEGFLKARTAIATRNE